uniref:ACT domain-containing protein ACR n=1 Tax=Anthurium amnicola TaxID=1678845 RepID=A0A1D1ZI74_9ARAE
MEWPAILDEYEKLVRRMNTPRVVIDNEVCETATLVKVDSARKHGILLEAVQTLTDLDLSIKKAYISSDGRWFMDVFHVTDQFGEKLTDESDLSYIQQSLSAGNGARSGCFPGLTALELTGTDRPGLLSEVFAVLADMQCDVADATVWTHSRRIASLIHVKGEGDGSPVEDPQKVRLIEARLRNVLKGDGDDVHASARTTTFSSPSEAVAHPDRRLHQMMFADRDYERPASVAVVEAEPSHSPPSVSVQNWVDRGYSIVNVQCRDRPKLLFDVVCTLTDMEYVVFHGTIDTNGDRAYQEFYIRHADGTPINSEAERQRVILCVQAAIERRASEGVRLELCAVDRRGLLSEVTRTFRENGLSVTRAEVSTKGGMARNVFYVTDAAGHPADPKTIEAVRQRVGLGCLKVKETPPVPLCRKPSGWSGGPKDGQEGGGAAGLFYLGSLFRRNLYNLGLIRSCS